MAMPIGAKAVLDTARKRLSLKAPCVRA